MNFIDEIREGLKKSYNEETVQKTDTETSVSPSGKFKLEATSIWLKESDLEIIKMDIYDQKLNQKVIDFFINDGQFFYGWVETNGIEYLISAEDIYGGQTVVDLTNLKISGYSKKEDGFIWTNFFLSPDGKTLATLGCYWACNTVIKLFDFSEPMKLLLREIKEIKLLGNDEIILGWLDNETLQMKGVKREREPEYGENETFRMQTISEVKVERRININYAE